MEHPMASNPLVILLLVLAGIVVAGLVLGLAATVLTATLRAIGILLALLGSAIAIVVGGVFDLLTALLALIPISWNAGVTLALVVLGRWPRAEQRAAAINRAFVGIAVRLRRALWDRPARLLVGAVRPAPPRAQRDAAIAAPPAAEGSPGRRPMAPPPPPPAWMRPPEAPPAETSTPNERSTAAAMHLLAFCGLAIPFANIFAPLVLWISKKDSSRFLDDQGRESISFNVTMTGAMAIALLLTPVFVGFLLVPVVALLWFTLTIVAAVAASGGTVYRYPLCIRVAGRAPASVRLAATPATPGPARSAERAQFPGYEVVGTLPAGGSGARLYIARPLAGSARRLPAGRDRVVIKSFALSEGSTLPQIVRESRSIEAATRLGLVLEHALDGHRFWYAMPYHPGPHFGEAVRGLHRMGPREGLDAAAIGVLLRWMTDLARTLDRYHAAGLWHKDVKPDNAIVASDGAHLVDIGLVTSLASGMTLTTHGTEYFRDPEMVRLALRGVKVHEVDGVRFDLYGLGAMLYLALEDTFPAQGGLSAFSKRSPEALRWVVRRAMSDYSKRYRSAAEMLADLDAIAAARDPFALRPADLPSMRAAASAGSAPVEAPALEVKPPSAPPADPVAAAEATVQRIEQEIAGLASSIGLAGSGGAASPGVPRERARRGALTSPGSARGSGRMVAAVVLFAAGMIVALLWASLFMEPSGGSGRDPAAIVVVGPQGAVADLHADSLLMASLREHFAQHRKIPAVRLVTADAGVASDVARLAEPLRKEARKRIFDRLDDAGIRGAVLIDPARGSALVAAASPIARSTALWGAVEVGEWGRRWAIDQVPLEQILPAAPGRRLLLLRDPAASAVIAPGETEVWRAFGIEVVEPDAETAAELALLLARPLGPEGRARIDAILEAQGCHDLRQVREALPARRSVGEPSAMAIDAVAPFERGVRRGWPRYTSSAHAAWAVAAVN